MTEEVRTAIVKELKTLRTIEHDYTIEKLAELSGVNKDTISRYESGSGNNVDILSRIVDAYGLNLKLFFDRVFARLQNSEEKNDDQNNE